MKSQEINFENIKYGILVEVIHDIDNPNGSYHTGMKVHFFNKKGVLLGNIYEFVPYNKIRFREEKYRWYPRYFMDQRFEVIKQFMFECICNIITFLLRKTQKVIS